MTFAVSKLIFQTSRITHTVGIQDIHEVQEIDIKDRDKLLVTGAFYGPKADELADAFSRKRK